MPIWFHVRNRTLVRRTRRAAVVMSMLSLGLYWAESRGQTVAPTTAVGATSATQTATISISVAGTLSKISVLTQGAASLDFNNANGGTCSVGTTYTAGQTCTVRFTFSPSHPWIRYGGISLSDASNKVLGSAYVDGVGTGPQVAFFPDTESPIGNSFSAPAGVAVDGSGNIYVTDGTANRVLRIPASDVTCATASDCTTVGTGLSQPYNVAVDGLGNVYIADSGNSRILRVPAADLTCSIPGDCTTVTSSGGRSVAVDGAGNVYVGTTNSVLRETLGAGGYTQTTVVPSTANVTPVSLAVDDLGDVFIADQANSRIVLETLSNGAYTQSVIISGLNGPQGIAIDGGGNVYIANTAGNSLLAYTNTGSNYALDFSLTSALGTAFKTPSGVGVDGSGILYVGDTQNARVVKLDISVPPALSFASTAVGSTSSDSPQAVTVGNVGTDPLIFAVPSSGTNPTVSANFSLNTSSTCSQLTSTSTNTASVAPSTNCTYNISFSPAASGSITGSVVLSDNNLNKSGATQAISVKGTGVAVPRISLSPSTSLAFGNQIVGTSSNASNVVVTNSGSAPLTISTVSITGDFSQTNNCTAAAVPVSGSCTVMVMFAPTTTGNRSGFLTLTDNGPSSGSQQQLTLSGYGIVAAPPTVAFTLNGTNGSGPQSANLIQGSDGNFYGTASGGGSAGSGTIFNVTPGGVATVLHNFTGSTTDGGSPFGGVIEGSDGNFYGMTIQGGTAGVGALYRVTSAGVFTLLHSFTATTSDGGFPIGSLVQGIDGNFYGVASGGGTNNLGTIFKATPAGTVTTLYSFAGGASDGQSPTGGLFQGSDGNLYGMTNAGGSNDGIIFRISPAGTGYTVLHTFSGSTSDGNVSGNSNLVQYSDGNLYGVTSSGGASNQGTFFSISPSGTFALLNSLASPANNPGAGAIVGSDGNFYFTAIASPSNGSIVQLTSSGASTVVTQFTGADGSYPEGIVQGMDGSLYGLTNSGGSASDGTVFNLPLSPALAAPVQLSISPATPVVGQAFTMSYKVANAYGDTMQYCFATNTAGDTIGWTGVETGSTSASTQSLTANTAGTFSYSLTCGGVESSVLAVTIAKATPTFGSMSFSPAASETYGTSQSIIVSDALTYAGARPTGAVSFVLNGVSYAATCSTTGSPETCSATLPSATVAALPAAAYTVTGSFAADSNYTAATASSGTFTITRATPSVAWPTPAAITYGTALSATQLDASATFAGASVQGTYAYNPVSGTVLQAGSQQLSVTFTPTDTTDFTPAGQSVTLTVSKATPSIAWSIPAAITYGTALSATQLNASAAFGGSSVGGSFTYSPAAGTVLSAGTHTLSVTFTPTDTTDFTAANGSVTITVNKATPGITWATPAAITYGTALSGTQLNATASSSGSTVAGSFVYTPTAGTVLTAGSQTLSVAFTPTDTTDYNNATGTVTLTVNKATPTVAWATPAAISYGTALSATQLNASASFSGATLPGSFSYTPASGTILSGGSQALSTIFTPNDTVDFTTQTAGVTLTVKPVAPASTVTSQTIATGTWSITVTVTIQAAGASLAAPTGAVMFTLPGATSLGTPSCVAVIGSKTCSASFYTATLPAGTYNIVATEAADANYSAASGTGTLNVATPTATSVYPACTLGIIQATSSTAAAVNVSGQCTDPKGLALTSTIDWGDGVIQSASAANTHIYPSLGSSMAYTIVLSSTDTANNSGSSAESVVVAPSLLIPLGSSTTIVANLINQSPAVAPTLVTFLCTSVSATVNGVTVSTALPSTYGIVCTSPTVTTSSTSSSPVTVTIQSSNGTIARSQSKSGSQNSALAFLSPLSGLALLTLGLLRPSRRRKLHRFAAFTSLLTLCFSLAACGGGFTPIKGSTPVANYYLTITAVPVTPPAPTGFVQTSLIVPITIK